MCVGIYFMHGLWTHIKFELHFKYILHIFGGKNRYIRTPEIIFRLDTMANVTYIFFF